MKKLLCIFVLLFTVILLLSSCDDLDLPIVGNGDNGNDSAHVHEFGDWCLTKSPGCVSEGQETRYCSCGESQTKVIVSVGHKYQSTQASPTCTAKGYTTYTCTCGDTYTEYVDALGHSYNSGVVTTAPGCETKGIKTFTCGNCSDSYTEEIEALEHSFDNGVVTTEPGCETKGIKTYTCITCNGTYTEDIDALGHSSYNGVVTTAPGCETKGVKTFTCDRCNDSYTEEIDALGHAYDNGVITTEPGCETKGVKTFTCDTCNGTCTEEIDALGHSSYNGIVTTVPGCETKGIKTFTCDRCNDSYTEEIDALGHAYDNGVITTEPGCETKGVKTFTCNRCNDSYTEDIAALGHTYDNGVVTTAPGCETKGIKTFICVRCSDVYTEDVNAIGHSFDNGVVTTAPGCETKGIKTFTCERCNGSYTEDVNAIGHSYTGVVTVEPGCETKGIKTYTCVRCSDAYTENVNELGHSYVDRRCVRCADILYSEGITFVSNGDGTCYITGTDGFNETELWIPPTSPAGDRVVKIAAYAFENLSAVTEVFVPDSVKTIGEGAFKGCNSIKDITLPFVGTSLTSESSYYNVFGYIFGYNDSRYDSDTMISQNKGYHYYYIPRTIRNVTITSQTEIPDSAFYGCFFIENITLCFKTEAIGAYAFYNCTNLVEIDVGTSLVSIGHYAFEYCSSLESITLPNTIESMGQYVFDGCTSLSRMNSNEEGTIVFPTALSTIPSYTFRGCLAIKNVVVGDITGIDSYAFSGCQNIIRFNSNVEGELIVPAGVTSISEYAFENLSLITKVVVPDTVKSISNGAFKGCILLEDITLPFVGKSMNETDYRSLFGYIFGFEDKVHSPAEGSVYQYSYVGGAYYYTFYWCYYIPQTIRNVTITSQTEIPSRAFQNCDFIETITLCFKTETIGNDAFHNCAKLVEIDVGTRLISIGEYAFRNCVALEAITLPDTVTNLGKYAFDGCTSLSKMNSTEEGTIVLPTALSIIPSYAFQNCLAIKNVVVGNITEIQSNAFSGCQNIIRFNSNVEGELIVPAGVTSISEYAFENLSLITKVVVPDTVKSISDGAFKGCNSIQDITLPFVGRSANESDRIYSGFGYIFGSVDGTKLNVSSDATLHYSESYSTGYTYRIYYFIPKTIRSVTVTSQTTLPSRAFYNCDFIETITFKSEITSVSGYAFYNCANLANIEIPNSVNAIGNYAFYNCKNLISVGVLNKVTAIGDYAFYNCNKLISIVIPDGVSSVGSYAFYGCKDLTILCKFKEQPSAWNSDWNVSSCPVVWGYVAGEHTYSFVTNGADSIEPIKSSVCIVLPTPVREGWYFAGWYDNAEFSGAPLQFSYYSATAHTLYAKWLTEEEWLAINDGTSFAKAYEITRSQGATVVIDTMGEDVYYKFTATIDGIYTFTSSGEMDTHCTLYNESYEKIGYGDDNGSNRNFSVTLTMSVGETVYLKVGSPAISAMGTFIVIVV